jgi:hypothetical protein
VLGRGGIVMMYMGYLWAEEGLPQIAPNRKENGKGFMVIYFSQTFDY